MRLAAAMHKESRFNEWPLDERELICLFGQYLESPQHRGWTLENNEGEKIGLLCVRHGKRRGVRVWEMWDELFYLAPDYRGGAGLELMVETLRQYRMEIQAALDMPVVLYLCPVASPYNKKIAASLERLGGKAAGYMVRMED